MAAALATPACVYCCWICDHLPEQDGDRESSAWRHAPGEEHDEVRGPILQFKHEPLGDTWSRIVGSRSLFIGMPVMTRDGLYWRFPLKSPIVPQALYHRSTPQWSCYQIEAPTRDINGEFHNIFTQPWNGDYEIIWTDQPVTCFHVTSLLSLIGGNPDCPGSSGVLNEQQTTTIVYKGAMRAGTSPHQGLIGIFMTTYFPGHLLCPPGSGKCCLEIKAYKTNRVKGGSACRQCAVEPFVGMLSHNVVLQALLVPFGDVPNAIKWC